MEIHLATDHAGFEHKEAIKGWLVSEGFSVVDHGASAKDVLDDFPDFISKAAAAVNEDSEEGRGMMANSYPNVRAVVYYGGDESIPALSRQHNDSNVISIGARYVSLDETKKVVWEWLHTKALTEEKYSRRNKKMSEITNEINS
jgi:ribose 5-phosphate isomerase B